MNFNVKSVTTAQHSQEFGHTYTQVTHTTDIRGWSLITEHCDMKQNSLKYSTFSCWTEQFSRLCAYDSSRGRSISPIIMNIMLYLRYHSRKNLQIWQNHLDSRMNSFNLTGQGPGNLTVVPCSWQLYLHCVSSVNTEYPVTFFLLFMWISLASLFWCLPLASLIPFMSWQGFMLSFLFYSHMTNNEMVWWPLFNTKTFICSNIYVWFT